MARPHANKTLYDWQKICELCGVRGPPRWASRWQAALDAFGITVDGRLPAGRKQKPKIS